MHGDNASLKHWSTSWLETPSRAPTSAGTLPPEVAAFVADAIVGGAPFTATLTRRPSRGNLAIPVVQSLTGQGWVAEGADIPDVEMTTGSEVVAVKKLGGIVLITREAFEDADWPIADEVARVVQDAFSRDLDLGLLIGTGAGANPLGVVGRASEVTAASLVGAVAAAVAEIGEDGGRPTHLALSPTAAATEAAREGNDGHPVHPTGMAEMQGLTVVPVPGLTDPLVYDAARLYSVVARDFRVERSTDYAPAFKGDKVALKITGRFGVGLPVAAKTIRKLTI